MPEKRNRDPEAQADINALVDTTARVREDDEVSNAFSNITELEEAERMREEIELGGGGEFLQWVNAQGQATQRVREVTQLDLEHNLERLGVVEADYLQKGDLCAERLVDLNPTDRTIDIPNRPLIELNTRSEATWIAKRLALATPQGVLSFDETLRHQLKTHLTSDSWGMMETINEIELILKKLRAGIEPALIALHEKHNLPNLTRILWNAERLSRAKEDHIPDHAQAYDATTGQRQAPDFRTTEVFFAVQRTHTVIGDNNWNRTTQRANRKPMDVHLGRFIWQVADLDQQLFTFEKTRQEVLSHLEKYSGISSVVEMRKEVSKNVFSNAFECITWKLYDVFCAQAFGQGKESALATIIHNNLLGALSTYILDMDKLAENVQQHLKIHTQDTTSSLLANQTVEEWSRDLGQQLNPVRSGPAVLGLLNKAVVEMISNNPVIMNAIYQAFRTHGLCLVSRPAQGPGTEASTTSIRLFELCESNPVRYLHLLESAESDGVQVRLLLPYDDLVRIFKPTGLLDEPSVDDASATTLFEARLRAVEAAMVQTRDFVARQLEQELIKSAEEIVLRQSQEAFADVLAQGPYEPTTLSFDRFPRTAPALWDSAWNAVESVQRGELDSEVVKGQARICGVYRANNDVTTFVFCGSSGNHEGYVRWKDCATGTEEGKAAAEKQITELMRLISICEPNAIVVAASGAESKNLFRTLERIVRERVHLELHYDIPVVWADPEIAIAIGQSSSAESEFGAVHEYDIGFRTAISLARYVRDPMLELCRLFDTRTDILALPLAQVTSRMSSEKMVSSLERELSLWMAAVAPEINQVIKVSQPELILQFFPGLGPQSATLFKKRLIDEQNIVRGCVSSRAQLRRLLEGCNPSFIYNVVTGTRVVLPNTPNSDFEGAHMLDCTLIPTESYGEVLSLISRVMEENSQNNFQGQAAVMQLWMKAVEQRYSILFRSFDTGRYANSLYRQDTSSYNTTAASVQRQLEFFLDELCNKGANYMRRNYRNMTETNFLRLTTGVIWGGRRSNTVDSSYKPEGSAEDNVLHQGDLIAAVPTRLQAKAVERPSLILTTQSGLNALMFFDDIGDQDLQGVLTKYVRENPASNKLPESMMANKPVVYGHISKLNIIRGEIILSWAPTPPPAVVSDSGSAAQGLYTGITTLGGSTGGDDQSVRTIDTMKLLNVARAHATKVSRHELFRNVGNAFAEKMMADRPIGDFILAPTSRDVRLVKVVLKIGEKLKPLNVPIREFQRPDGAIAYKYSNHRTETDTIYDDPDHCFFSLINPMLKNVWVIRNHMNFLIDSSSQGIMEALEAQQMEHGGGGSGGKKGAFFFVLTENTEADGNTPSPNAHITPYVIHYLSKNSTATAGATKRVKRARIVIEENLFLRIPEGNDGARYERCFTVEEMIERLQAEMRAPPSQY